MFACQFPGNRIGCIRYDDYMGKIMKQISKQKFMKRIASCMIIMILSCFLTACGKTETIEGNWKVVKEIYEDGTENTGEDILTPETYEIADGIAEYTCYMTENGGEKDIKLTLTVTDKGNNTYNFMVSKNFTFVTARIEGKYLVYTVGDETFYFEKVK